MKKIIVAFAVVSSALFANASYLYWQVSTGDGLASDGNGGYTFNGIAVSGFRIGAVDSNQTLDNLDWQNQLSHAATDYGYYDPINGNGDGFTSFANPSAASTVTASNLANNPEGVLAEISADFSNGYSYYIEIMGYENTTVIGLSTYTASASNLTSDLGGMFSVPVNAWTGTAYAAPEPTSGLLLLVGASLLALKRRKV